MQATSQLQGLLHMGLGRLGLGGIVPGQAAAHEKLLGCDVVLVFVVGGVSMAEVRAVGQEVAAAVAAAAAAAQQEHLMAQFGAASGAAAKRTPRVLLGGTALLSPHVTLRQLVSGSGGHHHHAAAVAPPAVVPNTSAAAAASNGTPHGDDFSFNGTAAAPGDGAPFQLAV